MNLFQAVNGAATFFILSALVAGLAKHLTDLPDSPLAYFAAHKSILWLGLFMIVFRVKTMLDDHQHFAEPQQGTNAFRYAGFVLALLSWIFWAIAAYLLPDTRRASELMAASILVSTLWLAQGLLPRDSIATRAVGTVQGKARRRRLTGRQARRCNAALDGAGCAPFGLSLGRPRTALRSLSRRPVSTASHALFAGGPGTTWRSNRVATDPDM